MSKLRKLGLSSVGDAPRCGAPRKITGAAEKWLSEIMIYDLYDFLVPDFIVKSLVCSN